MYRFFYKTLLAHPADVDESYFQHLVTAFGFAARMLFAASACFVHALVPCLCTRTASNALNRLHEDVYQHRCPEEEVTGHDVAGSDPSNSVG